MFGLGLGLLIAFGVIERRVGEAALIPPDVIANRPFRAACLTVLMLSAVFFSIILYVPQLMEKVLGFSALKAGFGMLPMLALFAVVAFLTGRSLYERLGGRTVIIAGTALLALGPLVVSFFGADSGYAALIPGLVLVGVGAGLFYPAITTAAVTMLDASRSSLAGGITYMFQIAGGAVGLGLTTALFTSRSEDEVVSDAAAKGISMTGDQAGVIHGVLAGTEPGQEAFAQFSPSTAEKVLDVVKDSFVAGVQLSLRVVAAIALVGLVIAIKGVRVPGSAESA